MTKKMLIINGSNRIKGNSLHIAQSLKSISEKKGIESSIINTLDYFQKDMNNVENLISSSDFIVLISPLYVDTFPYPVIDFMERIEKNYKSIIKNKGFFVIGQCNFPESRRIIPMLKSAEIYAEKLEMKWLGGLSFGGSVVMIEGKKLEEAGKVGAKMIKGMELAIDNILNGDVISKEAQNTFKSDMNRLIFKPFVFIANRFVLNK